MVPLGRHTQAELTHAELSPASLAVVLAAVVEAVLEGTTLLAEVEGTTLRTAAEAEIASFEEGVARVVGAPVAGASEVAVDQLVAASSPVPAARVVPSDPPCCGPPALLTLALGLVDAAVAGVLALLAAEGPLVLGRFLG